MTPEQHLAAFDALPRDEQRAWLGFFAGARGISYKYGDQWRPMFGKYECEIVDFETIWLGKFVEIGWLQITKIREFKALGIEGHPDSAEYEFKATDAGWNVREDYWKRLNNRSNDT